MPPAALCSHPELEAALARAPDDAGAWLVYEDWLLDRRDPRAPLIEAERAGDLGAAAHARGAIAGLLLGARAATFEQAISGATWRAGYLRACALDATGPRGPHRLAELLAAPAARLLTELELELTDAAPLAELAAAPLVRALVLRCAADGDPLISVLDAVAASGIVPRLARLAVHGPGPSRVLAPAARAAFRGGVFRAIAHVEVPAALAIR